MISKRLIPLIFFLSFLSIKSYSNSIFPPENNILITANSKISVYIDNFKSVKISLDNYSINQSYSGRNKLGVVIMAILTGPLGGHRLYLGTSPYVPIVYTLTLGGGMGLLPVIDVFVVVFSKDFHKFENNPQVIMWGD
ncbi:MAG: hypothetical protein JXR60_02370 [Bacteroidales bacterium]|nr:hypothetical protein [Bacteroidales bacterium]